MTDTPSRPRGRTPPRVEAGERVLLVFPGALGDLLLLAPAIAALRERGGTVELSVCRPLQGLASELFPGVHGPPADGASMRSLFAASCDPALAGWLRGATSLLTWLGDPASVAGHASALGIGEARVLRVERGETGPHASDAYASMLGVRPIPPAIPAAWRDVGSARPRAVVIHPGAGARAKRWMASGFHAVADAWRARGGETIVLLGPAEDGEREQWQVSGHEVASGLDLPQVAALLASVPRFVGNDSGISHLAGLLGRRGVVLFGPTCVGRWRPRGGDLEAIVHAGRREEEIRARVLARLAAPGHLDTPTTRH